MSEEPKPEDFEAAFARLSEAEKNEPSSEAPAPEAPAEAPPAEAEAPAAEEGAPAAEVKAEEPVDGAPEPAVAPAETPAKQPADTSVDEVVQRLAALVKEQPAQQKQQAQPAQQPEPQPAQQPTAEPWSPEEKEFLSAYEKDWPDVARGEALRRRAEYQELVKYVFNEVAKHLRPVSETVEVLASHTQLQQLQSRVPDYDTIRDQVEAWVETQPAYLQPAYKNVIEQGTAEEVVDLIGRYRAATGSAPPAPAPAKTVTELPADAKKAAASLAPVSTKRSAVPRPSDPGDFDSAWDQAAKLLGT